MNYTFFAIGCYVVMRAYQVFFDDCAHTPWFKITLKIIALFTFYSALSSLIVWYKMIPLLGFPSGG